MPHLVSTITGAEYPFGRLEEFAGNGESLEVRMPENPFPRLRSGRHLAERFREFLPFRSPDLNLSLGEGNSPLVRAEGRLAEITGIRELFLKNETQNPTWSFKDRGSLPCVWMARERGEDVLATISTGNMGHSIAAYAARAGMRAIVFVPEFATREKLAAMSIHGALIVRVHAPDYSVMKRRILDLAGRMGLRIVSGNGPIRAEGYKLTAFEIFEQMGGSVPEYVAVPTSACGHCRGLFKGFRELRDAGLTQALPKMIIVQAANNAPIVTGIARGLDHVVPFSNVQTVAEAITTGNPPGGDEIVRKAKEFGWPAMDVTEDEILDGQRVMARSGYFVEPAAATTLHAVRKLVERGTLAPEASVVLMLTGSGLKDLDALQHHETRVLDTGIDDVEERLASLL
jgi:threonine synthase